MRPAGTLVTWPFQVKENQLLGAWAAVALCGLPHSVPKVVVLQEVSNVEGGGWHEAVRCLGCGSGEDSILGKQHSRRVGSQTCWAQTTGQVLDQAAAGGAEVAP